MTPTGRERWRNGLHQRRWVMLSVSVRADRWDFLATLPHPPLVSLMPLDGWAVLPRVGERRQRA